jgi:hypothetical protein
MGVSVVDDRPNRNLEGIPYRRCGLSRSTPRPSYPRLSLNGTMYLEVDEENVDICARIELGTEANV